jgi:hypothetical protein
MKRITSANNAAVLPAALPDVNAPGFFNNNPGAGPGTVLDGDWLNGVQEEIISAIVAAGLVPTKADLGQLLKSMQLIRGYWLANTNNNFVVPVGIIRVTSVLWGGGGSGGPAGGSPGNGGGPGGFSVKRCTVAPGNVIPVIVGQGGAQPGPAAGGTSSFGAFHSATGGSGDTTAGIGVGGDYNFGGAAGSTAFGSVPGHGGGSPFGGGGGGGAQGGQVPGGAGGGGSVGAAGGGAHGASLVIW